MIHFILDICQQPFILHVLCYVIFMCHHFQHKHSYIETSNAMTFLFPTSCVSTLNWIRIFTTYWINHKWVIIRILLRYRRLSLLWYFAFSIKEQGPTIKFSLFTLIYLFCFMLFIKCRFGYANSPRNSCELYIKASNVF